MSHEQLLSLLEQPKRVVDVYSHKIDLSELSYVPLRETHAYPPCFVPIFEYGTAPSYRGVLRHFFVPRSTTYVNLLAHKGFHLSEYARTSEQFLMRLFIEFVSYEEEWNDSVVQASIALGIDSARSVFELWQEKEDECFRDIPCFQTNLPYAPLFYQFDYSGDFPSPQLNFRSLESYCGVELEEFRDRIVVESAPKWLTATTQKPVFDYLLSEEDYSGCWMCIKLSWMGLVRTPYCCRLAGKKGRRRTPTISSRRMVISRSRVFCWTFLKDQIGARGSDRGHPSKTKNELGRAKACFRFLILCFSRFGC